MRETEPPLIDGIIVGAQKAGTSSLLKAFSNHPLICTHFQREMAYFVDDELFSKGWENSFTRYFSPTENQSFLLAKNVGVMYQPDALARLFEHNPDVKVIVSLRNPVERAISAFHFFRRVGLESNTNIDDVIQQSLNGNDQFGYLARGRYSDQIKRICKIFPKSNVSIFLTDDFTDGYLDIVQSISNSICGEPGIEWIPNTRRSNEKKNARFDSIAKISKSHFKGRQALKAVVPQVVRDRLRVTVEKMNSTKFKPIETQCNNRPLLVEYFQEEVSHLEKELDRDLTAWRS